MGTFSNFLNSFDDSSKGSQFEYFVKWFLLNDPEWSTQVDKVWLWDEYPDRWGRDCGVDLIFKHKNGEIWAVQAKCYLPEYSITKADVDKFLSESNRNGIDKRLLIATTDQIGKNAKQVCDAQEKTVIHFLFSDFDKAAIEYPKNISELNTAQRKPKPTPRPHQIEAIEAVESGFKDNDRGQLIMACGTGKTYTTLWINERQFAQSTLVLLPSLSLLSQTLREWTFAANETFDVLCVCSDESVGKQASSDEIIHSVKDISFPVTSESQKIREFLKGDGNKVIFCTYQSSPIIAEAQTDITIPDFDLVVADEAHRCTGTVGNAFTTVLHQTLIRAHKRLFTTATPRTYSANLKKESSEMGVEVIGMDDESVFGKVLYALTFGESIKRGLLTDYQLVLVGVDKPMIAEWIKRRQLIQTDDDNIVDAKTLASQIGLIKAINDYDLKRMITFHSRVKRAENFASELHSSIELVAEKYRPDGDVWTDYVSGAMPTHRRRLKLDQLKTLTKGDYGLLSNAKCLAEGVDVPSLDGVAFIDPRASQVDIVQAVGRAIRLSDDKTIGTIVIPVFIEDGDDPDLSLQLSNFNPVWEVLHALKAHDELLAFELDKCRTDMGRRQTSIGLTDGLSKIIFDLPVTLNKSFSDALTTLLIEKTTSSWNFWFGLLEQYIQQEGHANVSLRYKTTDGYGLGRWVRGQRADKNKLTAEKISKLESLDGWVWNVLDMQWEQGFFYLKNHVEQKGHAHISASYKTSDDFNLGSWVSTQRKRKSKLTIEKISRLESVSGWTWDALDLKWLEGFEHLYAYSKLNKTTIVPKDYITNDGFKLGNWVSRQRNNKAKMNFEHRKKLEALNGWIWDIFDYKWEQGFSYLKDYFNQKGDTYVSGTYITDDGYKLGNWVRTQRAKKSQLTAEKISKLESLDGWVWSTFDAEWEKAFFYLKKYFQEFGNTKVASNYQTKDGFNLGDWFRKQKHSNNPVRLERLSSLDPNWQGK